MFWSIRWLEKQAEEELKVQLLGDTLGLEDFAYEENRACQILKQNENGIFNKRSRKALLSMQAALKFAWMLSFRARIEEPLKRTGGPRRSYCLGRLPSHL